MPLVALLLLPFVGSVVAALLPTRARTALAGCAGLVSAVAAVWVFSLFPQVRDGGVIRETISWVPSLGLALSLRIDGFAWMFALLVTVLGALVSLYARYYMSPEDPVARFYAFLLAFMGVMLGVVVSGNLLQLVVFWELTSLISFLLIGYWHHRVDAQRGARMALTVTGAGGSRSSAASSSSARSSAATNSMWFSHRASTSEHTPSTRLPWCSSCSEPSARAPSSRSISGYRGRWPRRPRCRRTCTRQPW